MDGKSREVVNADTMEVLNTPSMAGYKHVLVLKHSDAKKVWAYGLKTTCGEEVLKCMKDFVEVQLTADGLRLRRYHADGAGELVGQHIRKYLRDNKSTRTTKITWTPRNTPEMNSLSWCTNSKGYGARTPARQSHDYNQGLYLSCGISNPRRT